MSQATQYRLDTIEPGQLGYDEPARCGCGQGAAHLPHDEPGPLTRHEQATRDVMPTHRDVARLVDVVRGGELNAEERELLADLLDTIGSAVRCAPEVSARMASVAGDARLGDAAALGVWEPVEEGFTRLLTAALAGVR
jgi:hypothetical protein